jgi:hypothetical protein
MRNNFSSHFQRRLSCIFQVRHTKRYPFCEILSWIIISSQQIRDWFLELIHNKLILEGPPAVAVRFVDFQEEGMNSGDYDWPLEFCITYFNANDSVPSLRSWTVDANRPTGSRSEAHVVLSTSSGTFGLLSRRRLDNPSE